MRSFFLAIASLAVALLFSATPEAASLRVAPVFLDLKARTAASSIRIWNGARRPINVQVRVFRWTQRQGEDVYKPTSDGPAGTAHPAVD
jgi:fimbrial chaperone protein